MCGRFTLTATPEEFAATFALAEVPPFPPRYNIAPTQPVAVVVQTMEEPERHFRLMRWGLIPSWAKDPTIGNRLINARGETLPDKPSFRNAFKRRRCLIPANGFYEWKTTSTGKQPFYFQLTDPSPANSTVHPLFAFAGLWEIWQDIETCTIVTTTANELLRPIHDRMPAILNAEDYSQWLDPHHQDAGRLQALLKPYPATLMSGYPVSTRANHPSFDDEECMMEIKADE